MYRCSNVRPAVEKEWRCGSRRRRSTSDTLLVLHTILGASIDASLSSFQFIENKYPGNTMPSQACCSGPSISESTRSSPHLQSTRLRGWLQRPHVSACTQLSAFHSCTFFIHCSSHEPQTHQHSATFWRRSRYTSAAAELCQRSQSLGLYHRHILPEPLRPGTYCALATAPEALGMTKCLLRMLSAVHCGKSSRPPERCSASSRCGPFLSAHLSHARVADSGV